MSSLDKKIQQARLDNLLGLIEATKKIDYKDPQSVRDFYFYCLSCRKDGNFYALDRFKQWFPKEFTRMQTILNKRTMIKRDLEIMKALSKRVVFGSLTFSDSNLTDNETNMKKRAQRYLDKCLTIYEIVEEHGTQNTQRYHVHFLGIMRDNLTYIDFHNGWQDITFIEGVRNDKKDIKRVSKYLCDYVVKQVPTIRRTKLFSKVIKEYQEYSRLLDIDPLESNYKWLEIQKLLDIDQELPF